MRAVVQRVTEAKVRIDDRIVGEINRGLMILVGFVGHDDLKSMHYMCDKIRGLRIFEDNEGKMNLCLEEVRGELLLVPNFTLYGDCRKGKRPSYAQAATVLEAQRLYNDFVAIVREKIPEVKTGVFQADMQVELINDGPVTLLLDSDKSF